MSVDMFSSLRWPSKEQWAWILFDAGCWGYISVTIGTLVPLVFKQDTPDDEQKFVTSIWANTVAVGTLLAGLLCPIIGAGVDMLGKRKITVVVTGLTTIIFLTLFAFLSTSNWIILLILAVVAMMFYGILQSTYNSLLMHVSDETEDELAFMSALQCALGNAGAMLIMFMLGLNKIKDSNVRKEGAVSTQDLEPGYIERTFCLAAVWFVVLSCPFLWFFNESSAGANKSSTFQSTLRHSWASFKLSLMNSEFMKYMVATVLYNDASSTLDSVLQLFGSEIGISTGTVLSAAVANRWICVVSAVGWYLLCKWTSGRACLLLAIFITLLSTISCALLHNAFDYWVLNVLRALSGSGCYIFSRVLMCRLTNKANTSKDFGFMAGVSRVSGIVAPVVYGGLSVLAGPRIGMLGLSLFAAAGLLLMMGVDFDRGQDFAQSEAITDDEDPAATAVAAGDVERHPPRLRP